MKQKSVPPRKQVVAAAPPKPSAQLASEPQPVTEKARESWFFLRSSFPLRDAIPFDLESIWQDNRQYPRAANVCWKETGPRNWAGRVTCVLVDPRDPKTIYAGAAAGGLWRSRDLGKQWEYIWPKYLNQNIGAITYDAGGTGRIICATGEANFPSGTYAGAGIFVSATHGNLWKSFITAPGGGPLSPEGMVTVPRRIACIAHGAPDPQLAGYGRLAFGCVSREDTRHAGLYLDTGEQGMQFMSIVGERSYNCYSVVINPRNNRIYAAVETRGTLTGIWRSNDFGKHWERLSAAPLPAGETCGRISLALAPSNPEIIYALIAGRKQLFGVYKSVNGGDDWVLTDISSLTPNEIQHFYNNTITIHPSDPDFVVCGITNLHRTRNGGKKWEQISTSERGQDPSKPRPKNFVHADQHAIAIVPNGKKTRLIAGHDGGVSVSEDGGDTWDDRSDGMVTTMFYDVDVAPTNSRVFGGGAQDTGSVISGVRPDGSLAPKNADPTQYTRVLPSDGSFLAFDPDDERRVFGSTSGSRLSRHDPGQPFSFGDVLGGWVPISPPLSAAERAVRAYTLVSIRPATAKRKRQFWLATAGLWNSEDDGANWKPASPIFDFSAISALAFSPMDPDVILVGTTSGGFYRSTDNGATWSFDLAGPDIPRRIITKIQVHPEDHNTVALCVGSTTMAAAAVNGQLLPHSHVFLSRNMGTTWQDIDNRALPNIVYNALEFEAHAPFRIFVGGDAGVWCLDVQGWVNLSGTLPNVIVSDLVYHAKDRILTAATFGRGIWRLPIPEGTDFERELPFIGDTMEEEYMRPPAHGLLGDLTAGQPEILEPAFDAVFRNASRTVLLKWRAVENAVGYIIRFESEFGFVQTETSDTNSLNFTYGSDGRVTWRVWALLPESRNSYQSLPSTFFFFTGNRPAPPSPVLRKPVPDETVAVEVELVWEPVPGAMEYEVMVRAQAPIPERQSILRTKENRLMFALQGEFAYTWRVAVIFPGFRGPYSAPSTFHPAQ